MKYGVELSMIGIKRIKSYVYYMFMRYRLISQKKIVIGQYYNAQYQYVSG